MRHCGRRHEHNCESRLRDSDRAPVRIYLAVSNQNPLVNNSAFDVFSQIKDNQYRNKKKSKISLKWSTKKNNAFPQKT